MKEYKVETLGLTEKVYTSIKDMILNRELVPGQKLVQEDIASKLGVSRTPILSAFSKLEKEWLVKSIPRRGFFIYEMSQEERLNLFDIRLRLEPLGARKAAEFGTSEQKKELLDMALDAVHIVSSSDFAEFNNHDYEFHKQIMEMSQNNMLSTMLSSYNIISLSNQNASDINFKSSIDSHKKVAEAIFSGDPDAAEEVMLRHLKYGFARVKG
ncbi:MAG: GntR family transcriptional regulator [Spirochaetaceae bacterium]